MKTEKEVRERIKDLELMKQKDPKNARLYNTWLDAMYWILDEFMETK